MRYVLAVAGVAFFILWEVLYDDWQVTEAIVAELGRLWAMTGL